MSISIGMGFLDISRMHGKDQIKKTRSRVNRKKIRDQRDKLIIQPNHLHSFVNRNGESIDCFCRKIIGEYKNAYGEEYSISHFSSRVSAQAKSYRDKLKMSAALKSK